MNHALWLEGWLVTAVTETDRTRSNALGNRDHTTILHGLREIEKHKDLCVKADSIRNNLWSATR